MINKKMKSQKKQVILVIRNAGFGDMIRQVDLFFKLSDFFEFEPKIHFSKTGKRNEICVIEFFKCIGFSEIIYPEKTIAEVGLEKISSELENSYQFNMNCYNKTFDKFIANDNSFHKRLKRMAQSSSLYNQLNKIERDGIALHVRRGDVAQIPLNTFNKIFVNNGKENEVFHVRGVFTKQSIKQEISSGNYSRFASVDSYLKVLKNEMAKNNTHKYFLLSDGYTKIVHSLINKNKNILLDQNIDPIFLESELSKELDILKKDAAKVLIGEGDNLLYETILLILSSKVFISNSPGLFLCLIKLFELNIPIVRVGND